MGNFLKNLHPLLKRKQNPKDNQDPNYALISTLNDEMNNVERDAIESKLQSSLKTATSKYLDKFGDWFGVYRKQDEDDEKYRNRIIKYLLLKRGTNNSIVQAIKDYLDNQDADVHVYEPLNNIFYTNKSTLNGEDHLMGYYYRFAVINVTVGSYFPLELVDVINEFKPAGVKLYVTYDGASTIRGNATIKFWENLPKFDTYTEHDTFTGYNDTFYGHMNMAEMKMSDTTYTSVFKTNNSLINSLDVLTGSSDVGRQYINFGYITSYWYEPTLTSSVNQILTTTEGKEVPKDYYMYTEKKNNNSIDVNLNTENGVSYIYNNFNVRNYISKARPDLLTQTEDDRKIVSDFIGELTVDCYLKAYLPPDKNTVVQLQVYDFTVKKWVTVSSTDVSFYSTNVGTNIGYIKDYLNNDLNLFTRIAFNYNDTELGVSLDYLDLTFSYTELDKYSIHPYKGLIETLSEYSRWSYVEAFKVASNDNGDIIKKASYQPMKYVRLTDGMNDRIGKNLVSKSNIATTNNQYNVASYSLTDNIKDDEIVTITVKAKLGDDKTSILPYNSGGTARIFKTVNNVAVSLDKGKFDSNGIQSYTGKWQAFGDNNTLRLYAYPSTGTSNTTVEWVKIERGDSFTGQQISPNDKYTTDPNKKVSILLQDKDGNLIPTSPVDPYENMQGRNLVEGTATKTKPIDLTAGNYNQYWQTDITSAHPKVQLGDTITISFDVQMERGDYLAVYDNNANFDFYFGTKTFQKIGTAKQRLSVTVPLIDTTKTGTTWTLSFYNNNNGDRFTIDNIKIEKGTKATPYDKAPEDTISFLDRIVKINDVSTQVANIGTNTDTPYYNLNLQYSYYGDAYTKLFDLKTVPTGTNYTPNEIIDIYGLTSISYTKINPMSPIPLKSIWNKSIKEINTLEGSVSNMSNNFFNATWEDIDTGIGEAKFNTLNVLQDVYSGILDGATGQVVKLTNMVATNQTEMDRLSESQNVYVEDLTLGSNRFISDLANVMLTDTTYTVDNSIKVVSTATEVVPNTGIIKDGQRNVELVNSQYSAYGLDEPVQENVKYKLIIEGEFKDNLEYMTLYNSNPTFNEAVIYPRDVVNGVATKEFTAKVSTDANPRLNKDVRVYVRPYDTNVSKITKVSLIKVQ